MPIYEYRCPDCGHQFEALQKMSDDPLTDCPACSQHNVKKLISRSAFLLKGGGWYKDHYGLKSSGSSDSSGSSGKGEGAKSEGGKSDSGSKAAAPATPPSSSSSSSSAS